MKSAMSRPIVLLTSIGILYHSTATAQVNINADLQWISLIRPERQVNIIVLDDVVDGCWPNPTASRVLAELEFIRSGFRITEETGNVVVISAFGSRSSNGTCTVSQRLALHVNDFTLQYNGNEYIRGFGGKEIFETRAFATGGTEFVSRSIAETFEDQVRELLVQIETQLDEIEDAIAGLTPAQGRDRWLAWLSDLRQ